VLPNSINIELQLKNQNHMRMIPVTSSQGSIFKKVVQEFKKILKVASPSNIFTSILWGDNLLHLMRNLLKTLEREDSPARAEPSGTEATQQFVFIRELFQIALY
jgi:hypothetical protein